ncbi:MAG: sigma-70 family RNA polymerase sigma factor [Bryobacteraceae bacterium]
MRDQAGPDDAELLAQSRRGNQDAWTELFRRHSGPVFRYLVQMTASPALAEEIAQDTFVFLLDQSSRFRPERGMLRPWLIGVARNKLQRAVERHRRFEQLDGDWAAAHDADRDVLAREVRSAVAELPPEFREVVVLCELEELDYAEAAQVLGCPVGTVRSRLYRARRMLMKALAPGQKGCLR